jgi:hypothetical protein
VKRERFLPAIVFRSCRAEGMYQSMPSKSRSDVTPIRIFQQERLGQRFDEIAGRLKDQHVKIEGMVSRLSRCLATVQIVEKSVDALSSAGSIDEMRCSLTDAEAVLNDIARQLNGMGFRFS